MELSNEEVAKNSSPLQKSVTGFWLKISDPSSIDKLQNFYKKKFESFRYNFRQRNHLSGEIFILTGQQ